MTQFSAFFINSFNFFFIFVFFIFLIIKKIIPFYKTQILNEQEQALQQALLISDLEKKKSDLVILKNQQEAMVHELQKKVSEWHLAVQIEEEKAIQQIKKQKILIEEKKAIFHKAIHTKKIHTGALKKALFSVENSIKNSFKNQSNQELYLEKICLHNSKKVFNA